MKILFIYSQHDSRQLELIERAKQEMATFVDVIEVMEVDEAKDKFHIRATPAIIPICDHWQGKELLAEGVDGQLLITATAYKLNEDEDLVIHHAETHRLDNLIKLEQQLAIDKYTLELVDGGII